MELGATAWCDGHADEAETSLRWAAGLPSYWDLAVTLWWIATGEVRVGRLDQVRRDPRLPSALRGALALR